MTRLVAVRKHLITFTIGSDRYVYSAGNIQEGTKVVCSYDHEDMDLIQCGDGAGRYFGECHRINRVPVPSVAPRTNSVPLLSAL